ncbi:F-box/LRR-repeat protein 2-like [Chenopodium quinoa]|uniref:F-box/LRR-repeat protein 15-like leucin rich repeat domain-containing protein n=1 Tax=Chenopodium quinoa TaxID=63459 RepID=A0A803LMW0_CHEQI|nr:F-box/LRR-repeat protein 2-like [Chenopodium quinoa]
MEEESKDLLDECWEMIFDRLHHKRDQESISLVCKRFLSITNSLRVSIKFSDYTPISTISRLMQRFSNLKKIQFCNFRGDLNEAVTLIARSGLDLEELIALSHDQYKRAVWYEELSSNMKNLKVLKYSGGRGDVDLARIADSFPNLEELYIDHEGEYTTTVTDEGVDYMSSKLKRLRKIDLSNRAFITDKSLVSLSKNCPLLEHIKIYQCNKVTVEGISFLVNNSHHLKLFYILKDLKIDTFGVNGSSNFLANLRSLRLQDVDISDKFLFSIAEARLSLTDLAVIDCKSYTFTGISRLLLQTSQSLKSLDLGVKFLTNEHIEYLSCFLQNLTSIKLFNCSNLSDSAFVMITQRCPRLCHFAMTGSSLGTEEYNYDGLMKNRAVKYLNLAFHYDFSLTVLKRLLTIFPEVEKLDLSHCKFVRHDKLNVPDILECNKKLVELNLRGCLGIKYLTAKDMELSVLEKLILKFSDLNDEMLINFGRMCPRLIHLDLEFCLHVTEEGVKEVVKSCKQLRYLTISSCWNLDINIIPWIVRNRPSLRKLVSSSCKYPDDENQKLFLQQGCLVLKDPKRI